MSTVEQGGQYFVKGNYLRFLAGCLLFYLLQLGNAALAHPAVVSYTRSPSPVSAGLTSLNVRTSLSSALNSINLRTPPSLSSHITSLTNSISQTSTADSIVFAPGPPTPPNPNPSVNQEIKTVLQNSWSRWSGGQTKSITVAEVTALVTNPKITGAEAAELGVIADRMNSDIESKETSNNGSGNISAPTYSFNKVQNFLLDRSTDFTDKLANIVSSTNSNGTFNLYGSYTTPQLISIVQATLNDCYFVSTVCAVINENPALINKMIAPAGKGTFLVTFPTQLQETVTLTDGEIAAGNLLTKNNGCWIAVLGLAANQAKVASISTGKNTLGTSLELTCPFGVLADGGQQDQSMQLLTGQAHSRVVLNTSQQTTNDVTTLLNKDFANNSYVPLGVDALDHALAITGWNPNGSGGGTVTIRNPWGTTGPYGSKQDKGGFAKGSTWEWSMTNGLFTLSLTDMLSAFHIVDYQTSLQPIAYECSAADDDAVIDTSEYCADSTDASGS